MLVMSFPGQQRRAKAKNDLMPLLETETEHMDTECSPSRADSILLYFLRWSTGQLQAAHCHFLSTV